MKIIRCKQLCQSNRDGYCVGIPCYHGQPVEAKLRKTKSWSIKNIALWDAIQAQQYSLIEFAKRCGCSIRTLERWVFEGYPPKPDMAAKVELILGKPDLFPF